MVRRALPAQTLHPTGLQRGRGQLPEVAEVQSITAAAQPAARATFISLSLPPDAGFSRRKTSQGELTDKARQNHKGILLAAVSCAEGRCERHDARRSFDRERRAAPGGARGVASRDLRRRRREQSNVSLSCQAEMGRLSACWLEAFMGIWKVLPYLHLTINKARRLNVILVLWHGWAGVGTLQGTGSAERFALRAAAGNCLGEKGV